MIRVAALYVEKGGVYWDLPDVDPWDETRDARLYAGPWPVVAHPPCNHWCQLASVNAARYATFEIGDDGGCFEAALGAVRAYGGVLEHPAYSLAWIKYGLPVPGHGGWTQSIDDSGWTTAISQVAYGHDARKRTWLYAVACDLPTLDWSEPPANGQVGSGPHPGNKALRLQHGASSLTPLALRDVLLDMARTASPSGSAGVLIFSPELAAKITLGQKSVTRRPVKRDRDQRLMACTYQEGRVYAVQLMRGGFAVDHIRILSVARETIEWPLTWTEARLEGFASPAEFADKWRSLYGPDGARDVWRIEFERVD